MNLKKQLYSIFENPKKHKFGIIIQALIFLNISISIIIMFLQTEKSLIEYFDIFKIINMINVILFTFEYILRVYAVGFNSRIKRINYMSRPMMLIDLIAILPFYLSFFK